MAKKVPQDTIDLELGDHKITVHVLRVRDSAKVERIRQAVRESPVDNSDEQVLREFYYPVLAGCSSGDVPTDVEFLDWPVQYGNAWVNAVDKLNPGLLPQPESPEEDAKKEN